MKKVLSLVLCLVCLFAFSAVGLAETTSEDFLSKVQGTFVELFPELSKDEYHETWVEAVTPLVGAENADATISMLLSMCMGDKYGEEAITAYTEDPESMRFDCYYLGGVKKICILP